MTEEALELETRQVHWWLVLIEGILAILLGVLLLARPGVGMVSMVFVLGIYWFIKGIFLIISIFLDHSMWGWKLFAGIIGILAGIYILQYPVGSTFVVSATAIIMLGIGGIIMGIVNLVQAFSGAGWGVGILGVLSIIFGIILLGNTLIAVALLPWVLGFTFIFGGIAAIVMAFRLRTT
jgi:uncharacterized membrane protein HdeD (DUF308 family)